jgi:hypothetical protein
MFMYLDSRLKQVHYTKFKKDNPLWKKGGFASLQTENGTLFSNPWKDGGKNAPFDQKFYLILNVAVGAQNGWFFDGEGSKPWVRDSIYYVKQILTSLKVDGSDFAVRDFYNGMIFPARVLWFHANVFEQPRTSGCRLGQRAVSEVRDRKRM